MLFQLRIYKSGTMAVNAALVVFVLPKSSSRSLSDRVFLIVEQLNDTACLPALRLVL